MSDAVSPPKTMDAATPAPPSAGSSCLSVANPDMGSNTTSYTTPRTTPNTTPYVTSAETSKTPSCVDLPSETEAERAAHHTRTEHSLTFWGAIRLYYPAVLWALAVNLAAVCQGLDGQVTGALVGIEPFKQRFGVEHGPGGRYIIEARWLGAFNYANKIGSVIGVLCSGMAYDRLGPRRIIALSSLLSAAFVFVQFFAGSPAQLAAGILLNGCATSSFAVCATAYAGEVCPVVLRGPAASAVNTLLVAGQLAGAGVLKAATSGITATSQWAWRLPIATQWPLPALMLVLSLGPLRCPDPPYWLCRRGDHTAAEGSLRRLAAAGVDPAPRLSLVRETLRTEGETRHAGGGGAQEPPRLRECFRGSDLRRLAICLVAYATQALVGAVVFHDYAVYFFELAGLGAGDAFSMNVGVNAVGLAGSCLASWWLLQLLGRREAYLYGSVILALLQGSIGLLDLAPRPEPSSTTTAPSSWAQSAVIVLCNLVYGVTIGPYAFVLMSEVSSVRLRGFNIGLASASYQVCAIALALSVPFLINEDQGNLGGKIGFIFAGICGLCALFCFLCLPETKGRTFEELDHMFSIRLPARRFKGFEVQRDSGLVDFDRQGVKHTAPRSEEDQPAGG